MAGKTQKDEGAQSFLWPIKAFIDIVFVCLLTLAVWFVVVTFYLWRFVPVEAQATHIEQLSGFYVAHALNPVHADTGGKLAYQFFLQETSIERIVLKSQNSNKSGKQWRFDWLGMSLWDLSRQAIYIFGAKLATVFSALPLLLLGVCLAFFDGLAARYVRREEGGNESATRYHIWKKIGHSWTPVLAAVVFLICPVKINPSWFLLVVGLALVFGVRNQTKYFKKYL